MRQELNAARIAAKQGNELDDHGVAKVLLRHTHGR
jgi:hypothetical protein